MAEEEKKEEAVVDATHTDNEAPKEEAKTE